MQRLFVLPYKDRPRALREIAELTRAIPHAPANRLDLLLSSSPDPEQGLHSLVRLREASAGAFERLTRSTTGLRHIIAVFTHSRFLSEAILQRPEWAEVLSLPGELQKPVKSFDPPEDLPRFRREQILRIVVRDVLGLSSLADTTAELSDLADSILRAALDRVLAPMREQHGMPRDEHGRESKLAVLALGKLGGRELNYSSDIDFIVFYDEGTIAEEHKPSFKEYIDKVLRNLRKVLADI